MRGYFWYIGKATDHTFDSRLMFDKIKDAKEYLKQNNNGNGEISCYFDYLYKYTLTFNNNKLI